MSPTPSPKEPTGGVSGRWVVLGILLLTVAGILALALNAPWPGDQGGETPTHEDDDPSSSPPAGPRLEGTARSRDRELTVPSPGATDVWAALGVSEGEALVKAASELRRTLRMDPDLLAEALARLLDPGLDPQIRARLAFVLGTLGSPVVDAALMESVERFGPDAAYLRAALLALGAQRDPHEEDAVFALGDRPHGVVGPGGLGITVRRDIESPEVRAFLVAYLDDPVDDARYAAARSLDASIARSDVRAGLHAALTDEGVDAVAARVAEPLGRWAASAAAGPEREALLELLVARAVTPDLDEMRFRLEKELGRAPLPKPAWDRLLDASRAGESLAIRLFAITTLGSAGNRADEATVKTVRAQLEDLVDRDGDAGVRDNAAAQLGRLPTSDSSRGVLERAALRDTAWNVRYTALESLARGGNGPALRRVLDRATEDGEPRVADLAREIQARLPDR